MCPGGRRKSARRLVRREINCLGAAKQLVLETIFSLANLQYFTYTLSTACPCTVLEAYRRSLFIVLSSTACLEETRKHGQNRFYKCCSIASKLRKFADRCFLSDAFLCPSTCADHSTSVQYKTMIRHFVITHAQSHLRRQASQATCRRRRRRTTRSNQRIWVGSLSVWRRRDLHSTAHHKDASYGDLLNG